MSASYILDIDKYCSPRSDATERGVWSVSTLFAYKNFYSKYIKNENIHHTSLKLEMDKSNW